MTCVPFSDGREPFPVSDELHMLAVQMAEAERDQADQAPSMRLFRLRMADELEVLVDRLRKEALQ